MFNKIIFNILEEQDFLKGRKTKPLVDAITNRNPITFYYSGPKSPEKESVKPGVRVRAEAVALGLSKKGNLIVRAFVQPPSTSKKGFTKTGWRTFMVNRMSNLQIMNDETFDNKRPGYKEGEESKSGPMSVTYVTTDWGKTPEVKPTQQITKSEPEVKPQPTKQVLPQPKTDDKPSVTPEERPKDFVGDIFKKLQTNIKDVNGNKIINTNDYLNAVKDLYKLKQDEWVNSQKEVGGNLNPGSGTRRRFEISSNNELSNILSKNGITVSDETIQTEPTQTEPTQTEPLQENINRIKSLMLLLN